jgi:HisJ family histidinol phosphate phosphatase
VSIDPRIAAIPDVHGHAKGEHPLFDREHPVAYTPRMLFLWFHRAAERGYPRALNVSDHTNYLTPSDPEAVAVARQALALAGNDDIERAAELAGVTVSQASTVARALQSGMRFTIGIEADDDPRSLADAPAIVDALQPECIIRSVHFLPIEHPESGERWMWPFDNPEFAVHHDRVGAAVTWELYIEKLMGELETQACDVVGHFYVPAKFGHWPSAQELDEYEDRLLDVCAKRSLAVELNVRLLYRDTPAEQKEAYLAAYRRLLAKAGSRGVRVAVGSDAHAPGDQGRGFEFALQLLDEAGLYEATTCN